MTSSPSPLTARGRFTTSEQRLLERSVAVLILVVAWLLTVCGCGGPSASAAVAGATPAPSSRARESTPVLGDIRIRARDAMTMVYVPAGDFEMGLTGAQVDHALRLCSEAQGECVQGDFRASQPAHTVALSGYWIDQTEVTNAMYAAFLRPVHIKDVCQNLFIIHYTYAKTVRC